LNKGENPLQQDDIRRAQLVEAAQTLVAWVHERRATWPLTDDIGLGYLPQASELSTSSSFDLEPIGPLGDSASYADLFAALPEAPATDDAGDVSDAADVAHETPRPRRQISFAAPLAAMRSVATALQQAVALASKALALTSKLGTGAATFGPAAAKLGGVAVLVAAVAGAGWAARPYVVRMINAPQTGTAVFESLPPSEVLVDGESIGTAPMTAELPAGHHVIQFRRRRGVRTVEIDVVKGNSTTARLDWDAAPVGQLTVSSDPAGARVLIDGKDRGTTPLTLSDMSLGSHTVAIQSDQGTVRRTVTVTADRAVAVNEAIFPGWFKVFAPFEVLVTEGTRPIRLDDQNQVMLAPGVHELKFENTAFGYSDVKRVEVQPGETASLSLVPSPSLLTVVADSPAIVIIDGQQVGETPLTNHPIALGTRDIIVRTAAGEERQFTRTVTVAPVSIDVKF
jgi:PEGA domain-containing protein